MSRARGLRVGLSRVRYDAVTWGTAAGILSGLLSLRVFSLTKRCDGDLRRSVRDMPSARRARGCLSFAHTGLRQSWISALGAGGFSGWCALCSLSTTDAMQVHAHDRSRASAAQGRAPQAAAGATRGGRAGCHRGRQGDGAMTERVKRSRAA